MEVWRAMRLYRNIVGLLRHPRKQDCLHPIKVGALMDAEVVLRGALGIDYLEYLEIGKARAKGLRVVTQPDGFGRFENAGWDRVPVVPRQTRTS